MARYLPFILFFSTLLSPNAKAQLAPDFRADTLRGDRITLRHMLKPERGILLAFWASWCTPCLEELKHVQAHLKEHPDFPMDVLTVNVDTSETSTDVTPTLRMYGFTFPVIMDSRHEIFSKYHSAKTLPFSVLIGPNGTVEKTFNGFQNEMFQDIYQTLKPKEAHEKANG